MEQPDCGAGDGDGEGLGVGDGDGDGLGTGVTLCDWLERFDAAVPIPEHATSCIEDSIKMRHRNVPPIRMKWCILFAKLRQNQEAENVQPDDSE